MEVVESVGVNFDETEGYNLVSFDLERFYLLVTAFARGH